MIFKFWFFRFLIPMFYILDEPPVGGGGNEPPPEAPDALPEWAQGVEFPEGLDDGLKKEESLNIFIKDKKIDYAQMMKSFVHAQKMVGKDKVIIPNEKSTDEDWGKFFDKVGRPELDKYNVRLDEGQEVDKDFFGEFKKQAHEAGLLPKQAEKMFHWYYGKVSETQKQTNEQLMAEHHEELEKLKSDWGYGFDKEVDLAKRALRQFVDEDGIADLKNKGYTSDPKFIKLMNQIGKSMKEDTFKHDSVGTFGITKDEAQDKINSMFSDLEGPYLNRNHAGHKKAVNEMLKLQEIVAN